MPSPEYQFVNIYYIVLLDMSSTYSVNKVVKSSGLASLSITSE